MYYTHKNTLLAVQRRHILVYLAVGKKVWFDESPCSVWCTPKDVKRPEGKHFVTQLNLWQVHFRDRGCSLEKHFSPDGSGLPRMIFIPLQDTSGPGMVCNHKPSWTFLEWRLTVFHLSIITTQLVIFVMTVIVATTLHYVVPVQRACISCLESGLSWEWDYLYK